MIFSQIVTNSGLTVLGITVWMILKFLQKLPRMCEVKEEYRSNFFLGRKKSLLDLYGAIQGTQKSVAKTRQLGIYEELGNHSLVSTGLLRYLLIDRHKMGDKQ